MTANVEQEENAVGESRLANTLKYTAAFVVLFGVLVGIGAALSSGKFASDKAVSTSRLHQRLWLTDSFAVKNQGWTNRLKSSFNSEF